MSPVPDAICITTNGAVKTNGACVMGRGIAQQARDKFPGIDKQLGKLIDEEGNHVHDLGIWNEATDTHLISFPVKHHWREQADIELIYRSTCELVDWCNRSGQIWRAETLGREAHLQGLWTRILLPQPGCGNGGLDWESDVENVIKPILDDRFIVVTL